jgi:hypothetical protein
MYLEAGNQMLSIDIDQYLTFVPTLWNDCGIFDSSVYLYTCLMKYTNALLTQHMMMM